MAAKKKAKDEASAQVDLLGFEYGSSPLHEAFRSDPFKRLLILATTLKRTTRDRRRNRPSEFSPEERKALSVLQIVYAASNGSHGSHYRMEFESAEHAAAVAMKVAKSFSSDEAAAEAAGKALGPIFEADWAKGREISSLNTGWNSSGRERTAKLGSEIAELRRNATQIMKPLGIMKALATRVAKGWNGRVIEEAEAEEVLADGQAALSEAMGLDFEGVDALRADPALCLALCRLAFGGPTELDGSVARRGTNPEWRDLPWPAKRLFGPGHPLEPCVGDAHEMALPVDPDGALAAAGRALSAQGRFAETARSALLKGTGTDPELPGSEAIWSQVPACGDCAYRRPTQTEPNDAGKRALGASGRGEAFRDCLDGISNILSWRNPATLIAGQWGTATYGVFDAGAGPKALAALAAEAEAHERGAAAALAAGAAALAGRPKLKGAVCSMLASRVAKGFSDLPAEPDEEDLLPGLEELTMGPEAAAERGKVGKLSVADDPMAKVALAAAKSFSLTADAPTALVGEAKRALSEKLGLSGAAWKALAGNPALRDAFAKVVGEVDLSAASRRGTRGRPATRVAAEIMKAADADGSAFAAKLATIGRQERALSPALAAAKAMSVAALSGISEERQEDLLALVAASSHAKALFSGMLPRVKVVDGDRFDLRAKALASDAKALGDKLPAFVRAAAARLDRSVAKSEAATPAEKLEKRAWAIRELSDRLSDICDCAHAMPAGFWEGLDPKRPFEHALRMHEQWVAELRDARVRSNPKMAKEWEPLVGAFKVGRVEFVELVSGIALHEEGEAMSHCVSGYASHCEAGKSRIFSVRVEGSRHCTLELAPHDGSDRRISELDFSRIGERRSAASWRCVQNRGKHNAAVTASEILEACEAAALQASEAFAAKTEAMSKALMEARAKAGAPK